MSSRKGAGQPFVSGTASSSSKGKTVSEASRPPAVDQLAHGVADISLDSANDGQWKVQARKPKNRAGTSAVKSWGDWNANSKAWGHPDAGQKLGIQTNGGSGKVPATSNPWPTLGGDSKVPAGRGNSDMAPTHAIRPPLAHGWQWTSRAGSTQSKGSEDDQGKHGTIWNPYPGGAEEDKDDEIEDDDDDDADDADDSDDELLSDEFDSDTSQKSFETRKKRKWFRKFFETLGGLSIEALNESGRQWHCPACQGGPGSIDWYRGLQPLMTHARTKGGNRMKLHRELAELLDEELCRRGTSVVPAGEAFGKWNGLSDKAGKDHEIIWPPMVVIMNTQLEKDDNDKWIGMGNQELLDYFNSYEAVKARHAYGPQGHRGMSVLIFESSAVGYLMAGSLHKHFQDEGTDRDAWDRRRVLFYPGGKRQLYGYMATKEDLDTFNKHCQGKSRLKYEMRSYQEMYVKDMKQMNENNQQLSYYKSKAAKEQRHSRAIEQSFSIVTEKLRKTMEENLIVRHRSKMQHQQNKEEMDSLDKFYQDQYEVIEKARDEREDNFEKLQQEEREKVKHSNANPNGTEDNIYRTEVANFITSQDQEMDAFVAERENVMKAHQERKVEMKRQHWEEELELERELNEKLNCLMQKYTPQ